jgi:hypothetical protein
MNISLSEEQVLRCLRIDVWDPAVISQNLDRCEQASGRYLAGCLGEGPTDGPHSETDACSHQDQSEQQ